MYVNKDGLLDYRSGEETSEKGGALKGIASIAPEILSKAAEMVQDVGGTAVKVTAGTAVAAGGGVLAANGGAAVVAGAAVAGASYMAAKEISEGENNIFERIEIEDAHGGVSHEVQLAQAAAPNESASITQQAMAVQPEEEVMDPFEAFRLTLEGAGFSNATEISTESACLTQSHARQQSMSQGLSL